MACPDSNRYFRGYRTVPGHGGFPRRGTRAIPLAAARNGDTDGSVPYGRYLIVPVRPIQLIERHLHVTGSVNAATEMPGTRIVPIPGRVSGINSQNVRDRSLGRATIVVVVFTSGRRMFAGAGLPMVLPATSFPAGKLVRISHAVKGGAHTPVSVSMIQIVGGDATLRVDRSRYPAVVVPKFYVNLTRLRGDGRDGRHQDAPGHQQNRNTVELPSHASSPPLRASRTPNPAAPRAYTHKLWLSTGLVQSSCDGFHRGALQAGIETSTHRRRRDRRRRHHAVGTAPASWSPICSTSASTAGIWRPGRSRVPDGDVSGARSRPAAVGIIAV